MKQFTFILHPFLKVVFQIDIKILSHHNAYYNKSVMEHTMQDSLTASIGTARIIAALAT